MSEVGGDIGSVLAQKLDEHVKANFQRMFLNHNEHGVTATILVEMGRGCMDLYGEYSQMTPILERIFNSIDAGIYASSSIGGKGLQSFLQKNIKITQVDGGIPQKKGGMFGGLDQLVKGQQRNADASGEMQAMGRL